MNHLCVLDIYRAAQDKVISYLFQLMDEWHCDRAPRDYRLKFPDELFAGSENGESLNGQVWFGAECLAAGSNLMNFERESDLLRPIACALTTGLDTIRMELRKMYAGLHEGYVLAQYHRSIRLSAVIGCDLMARIVFIGNQWIVLPYFMIVTTMMMLMKEGLNSNS